MQRLSSILLLFCATALLTGVAAVSAGPLQLDHDAAGQLLRVVPEHGPGLLFRHDPAGNIIAVLQEPGATAPEVSEQTVDRLRCGQATEVTLIGDGLEGARPVAVDDGLRFTDVRHQDGALRFRILADCDGAPGETVIRLRSAGGEVLLPLTVDPARPALIVRPSPLAVAPDGGARGFEMVLSHADTRRHDVVLSIPAADIADLESAALLSFQPGETRAFGVVRGKVPGSTVLTLKAEGLGAVSVPLLVTESAVGVNTLLAPPLGLAWPVEEREPRSLTITLHHGLGVASGRGLLSVTPSVLNRDAGEQTVQIAMQGMGEITGQSVQPGDGLEIVDSRRSQPDTLELRIRVESAATPGLRRLRIADEHGVAPALRPGADRLLVAHGHPLLHSVSPNRLRLGASGALLTLRGEYLDDALAVTANPPAGIELGAPTVTESGKRVQVLVSVAPDAAAGPRQLRVRTPAAETDGAASPGNTLHLVTELGPAVDTLSAPALGIQSAGDGDPGADSPFARGLAGRSIGVVAGSHLLAVDPDVIVPGREQRLTLAGRGFHAGHSPYLDSDQGVLELEIGNIAADGSSAELHVRLEDDARLGVRRLRIADGHGKVLPPASPGADVLRITPAGARIDSVSPLHLPRGTASEVTVRGERLQDARAITLQPDGGVTAEAGRVAEDGRVLRFRLAVSADADPGPRRLQVETLAGSAEPASAASNTVYITEHDEQPRLALNDALLGIYRVARSADDDAAVAVTYRGLPLGVQSAPGDGEFPARPSSGPLANAVGVSKAPVLSEVAPDGLAPDRTATVTATGQSLDRVSSISVVPADGIIVEGLSAHADGKALDMEVTVEASAAAGMRRLLLKIGDGVTVPAELLADRILIGPGTPRIDSVSPILGGGGDAGTLLIRGEGLQMVAGVRAIGEPGLSLGAFWSSKADGTELSVSYAIDPEAPPGQRTIQVLVPGDRSSADASPANTFTVYDEVPD
ncbi:hypothetical protein M0534_11425 [Methylonatrum kenyense]|uniref:hypothetical protein n=1 Tax=Methylonatrum kenyense TaxID=455253 RepID=UPI0020C079B6|nr:hypothetical protein [Methylonatrum kenyense]MCK8516930.1 hypothetical protein [Methylonatrum kenyense]